MRWFDDKETNFRSSLIPYTLYAINEEVYDEIVCREDGYYLIKRCGEKPATLNHGETTFITNGKKIIYPLPISEIREIKLDWVPPMLLGEFSRLGMTVDSIPVMEGMAKIDRRYIEKRKVEKGKNFTIDKNDLNPRVPMYIKTIHGSSDGVGIEKTEGKYYIEIDIFNNDARSRRIEICIGNKKLFENDYIRWNNVLNKYQIFSNSDIENLDIDKIEILLTDGENIVKSNNCEVSLYIPIREIRQLETPKNIRIYGSGIKKGVSWEHVVGAERYEVYLDEVLIETTEYNGYVTENEFEGFMKVRALNSFVESEFTETFYIKSVPNEPYEPHLENYIENGQHIFKISFTDNSELETNYRIRYSVDGRQDEIVDLDSSQGVGTLYNHIIKISEINESFKISVTAVNEIGETEIVEPITRYIIGSPRWTYKTQSSEILMEWVNEIEGIVRYKIIMEKDGEIMEDYAPVDVAVGASMRYTTNLDQNSAINVTIVPIDQDGNNHIYTKPIRMSKETDKTLVPMKLTHIKISDTVHEFSWDDIYNCENEYEVVYSVSGGQTVREIIPTESKLATGRKYRYLFTFEEHGFINIKVRMNWDLGSSEYSNEITAYHIPSSDLPPAYIRRNRVGDNINILWEGQEYVKDYDLLVRKGRDEDKIITVSDNSYLYNLPVPATIPPADLTTQEKNKWKFIKYPNSKAVGNYPDWEWIEGLTPLEERIVSDHMIKEGVDLFGNQYVGHFTTYLFLDEDYLIETKLRADDRATLWLNGKKVVSGVNGWTKCNLDLKAGWNIVEILLLEISSHDYFVFENNMKLSTHPAIRTMTSEDRFLKATNDRMEFRVRTRFLNGVVSEYSEPMIFTPDATAAGTMGINITPTKIEEIVNTTNVDLGTTNKYDLVTKSSSQVSTWYTPYTRIITKHTMAEYPQSAEIHGAGLRTVVPMDSSIILKSSKQFIGKYNQLTTTQEEAYVPIGTYVKTMINQPYQVYTEVNKVTIVCIGDSITSGHPGWWAETGTGDIRSQYEYWLDIRLKGQFNIINKGYGSDTTDDILARFDKDVLGYNAQYCIIQGGTNDLYWAMAEANGDKAYLDGKVTQMKNNIEQMVRRCWDNGIIPIVGTLIPRTGATGIYKDALYEYNEWIINFCTGNDNIFYVDFFNAGKEKIPPTPLEDPANPGAMNPIYDGDALYDEYGNLIKQGRGIHLNWEGYRIMGECIPLNIFKTGETGLKLYLDKECTVEETYNDDDKVNPFYRIDINGIRRGVPKKLIRYVKNVGTNQQLFAAYSYNNYNIDVKFLDENGRRMDYANGLLPASAVAKIEMRFDVHKEDSKASVNLYLASREFKIG